jgi:predicted nucleotidyltransferase
MNKLKKLLLEKYPDYIEKIIIFGSRVEDKENEFSDYDILVILKKQYDWQLEKEMKLTTYDINIDYDIITDINLINTEEINGIKGSLPFIKEALINGTAI